MARKRPRKLIAFFIVVGLLLAVRIGYEYGTHKVVPKSAMLTTPKTIDRLPPNVQPPLPIPPQIDQNEGPALCSQLIDAGPLSVIKHVLSVYAGFPNVASNRANVALLEQMRRDGSMSQGMYDRTSRAWLNTTYKANLAVSTKVTGCGVGKRSSVSQQLLFDVTVRTTSAAQPIINVPYSVDVVRLQNTFMVINIGPQSASVDGGDTS